MTNIRLESHGNSQWGDVVLLHEEEEYDFPYHIPTGEIFNLDPPSLIRCKCIALVALTPLTAVGRSIYWLAKSIFMVLTEAFRYLDGQHSSPEYRAALIETASDSLRALGYGVLLTGCALIGIFNPYGGRQQYGQLERDLNRHVDGPHRDKFYLAFCFQRLIILPENDPQNSAEVENKLIRYLTRLDAIRAAIWSLSYQQLMTELRLVR